MRCREAKHWLAAQRDGDQVQTDVSELHEHLEQCPVCRTHEQHHQHLDTVLHSRPVQAYTSISTERIMRAVQEQRRITRQLEYIRLRQQSRVAQWRVVGLPVAGILLFTLCSIPLLLLALAIVQPELLINVLSFLSDAIALLVVLGQYLQVALVVVTSNSWLLSGVAFILVVMTGMWLRLMRYPQEA